MANAAAVAKAVGRAGMSRALYESGRRASMATGLYCAGLVQLRGRHMFKEFKEFAVRGNVVDMAVGIIIGGAFGTIVQSLVKDVIMPPIGLAPGGVDFS